MMQQEASRPVRKATRPVQAGPIRIGGLAPVSIQSMTCTDPHDRDATLRQVCELAEAGCDLVRLAIPDLEAASVFGQVRRQSPVALIADIHFDYRLALEAIRQGADKIRINPGNIGGEDRVRAVANAARERGIPIRIGVNSGSLPREILARHGGVTAEALSESALEAVARMEACGFADLVVSVKSSDPWLTIRTNRILSDRMSYPLHLGVTEAGTPAEGVIRSAVGIGTLLAEGIGDTFRVSLTGDPVPEVHAARSILRTLHLAPQGIRIVSCPTCGRTRVNLADTVEAVERAVAGLSGDLTVAIMGCAVNGPGEAREADVGLAGGDGDYLLFSKGQVLRKVPADRAVEALLDEIRRLLSEGG